ncbi:hypothetical protein A1F96_01190 [Pyrenophora tritici-repentis]|nr:hypothetical protein PtrEW7m1_007629 [Pyrenophora tritici-repentis]PWO29043.1 GPI inositol-deacylase [Pyrenophora tritici-repentis]PZD34945.1 hypothetical protein A1F96_01190 [Pyrenophora tritici-repentis]
MDYSSGSLEARSALAALAQDLDIDQTALKTVLEGALDLWPGADHNSFHAFQRSFEYLGFRFMGLDESLFPNNEGDYASSYMYPGRATGQLYYRPPAANPPPWETPADAWRYDGNKVWTGEAFVFSRRTQPEPDTRTSAVLRAFLSSPGLSQDVVASQGSGNGHLSGITQLSGGSQEHVIGYRTPPTSSEVSLMRNECTFPVAGNTGNALGAASQVPDASQVLATSRVPAATGHAVDNSINSPAEHEPAEDDTGFYFTGWNDEAKRMLYLWKGKNKKGYQFFAHLFPGETKESLHAAWVQHKREGKQLYKIWAMTSKQSRGAVQV